MVLSKQTLDASKAKLTNTSGDQGVKRMISSQHRKRGGHSFGGGPYGTHALLRASLELTAQVNLQEGPK